VTDLELPAGERPVVVVGAGPAGLTAAYELSRAGIPGVVLEKDAVVGGISRTVLYRGYRFDIGGHRFFTKVAAVERLWREVLGDDLLLRPRLSRILYRGRYFDYPLKAWNVLRGLGLPYATRALLSYAAARVRPRRPERTLEDWVVNRFGERLYRVFFKTYTEKVWGMPCSEIGADWAAQRIRGLSLSRAVAAALLPRRSHGIRTLVDAFHYPRLGPGQMWEAVRDRVTAAGLPVWTETEVVAIRHTGARALGVDVAGRPGPRHLPASHVISSMPVRELVERLDPPAPARVLAAARALRYRDFLAVALIVDRAHLFPDNWIYVHDPGVRVGRIQNFGNWSPDLVPDPRTSCLGMEYFCFEGDPLWRLPDAELLALARGEAVKLGIVPEGSVTDGAVVRMPKAYPVYDAGYGTNLGVLRAHLSSLANVHPVGRNGLHRYNNQDHSMFTAMLAVRNILGERHDVWAVNADCEYHEEAGGTGARPPADARTPSGRVPAPPVAPADATRVETSEETLRR
jgi:protoporphyrinogen oxidase